jgi:hypothetical protein
MESAMTVLNVALIVALGVLLVVVPAVVVARDMRNGRPDPGYDRH